MQVMMAPHDSPRYVDAYKVVETMARVMSAQKIARSVIAVAMFEVNDFYGGRGGHVRKRGRGDVETP